MLPLPVKIGDTHTPTENWALFPPCRKVNIRPNQSRVAVRDVEKPELR